MKSNQFTYFLLPVWNRLKLFDRNLIIFWLLLSLVILLFRHNVDSWVSVLALHLGLIGLLILAVSWLDTQKNMILHFFRYWYIIIAFPFLYFDVGGFIHIVFPHEFDPMIIQLEKWVFGVLPNIWVQQYVTRWLTEIMQISYGIYWLTIPIGGAIFYFSREFHRFERLLHYVTITFFISYFAFIFFPVAGPRFYIAEQITVQYDSLFLGYFLRDFVKEVGFRGGAFPSSHVAVAVVILIFVWRYRPRTGLYLFLPMVIALSLSTVYGQYHYLTDVLAGMLLGGIIGFWGIHKISD